MSLYPFIGYPGLEIPKPLQSKPHIDICLADILSLRHFRVLVESGRHYLSMVSQSRVSAASVANDPGSIFRSRHSTSCRRSLSSLRSSSSRGRLGDDEPDQAPTELAVPRSATPATDIREGAEDSSVEPTEMAGNGAARNGTAISSKEEEDEEYESDFVEE